MKKRELTVLNFEPYPMADEAQGVSIRLMLKVNGRMDTVETYIPIEECVDPNTMETYDAETIVLLAINRITEEVDEEGNTTYKDLKQEIEKRFIAMENKACVIGMKIDFKDVKNEEVLSYSRSL